MTKLKTIAVATLLAAIALSTGPASAAGVPPGEAGYYSAIHYVLSSNVSGAGQCVDSAQTYFTSSFYYPGPNKAGAMEWRAVNIPGVLGQFIQAFPTTPAANKSTWSGTYTSTFYPGGTPTQVSFNATNTRFDARSSVSTVTYSYPTSGGGTCTTMEQITYSYSGSGK